MRAGGMPRRLFLGLAEKEDDSHTAEGEAFGLIRERLPFCTSHFCPLRQAWVWVNEGLGARWD